MNIHVCMYVYTYVCMYVCIYMYLYVYICIWKCVCVCVCVCVCILNFQNFWQVTFLKPYTESSEKGGLAEYFDDVIPKVNYQFCICFLKKLKPDRVWSGG